jgi:hypothetical protein
MNCWFTTLYYIDAVLPKRSQFIEKKLINRGIFLVKIRKKQRKGSQREITYPHAAASDLY